MRSRGLQRAGHEPRPNKLEGPGAMAGCMGGKPTINRRSRSLDIECRARMLRDLVGTLGAWFINGLIWLFGRRRRTSDVPWLVGPLGGARIGERPYEETATAEGLTVVRKAQAGGLIPSFDVLAGPSFDPGLVHPKIRDFYERTYAYRLDTWATTYFPARLARWLLVTTISRRV